MEGEGAEEDQGLGLAPGHGYSAPFSDSVSQQHAPPCAGIPGNTYYHPLVEARSLEQNERRPRDTSGSATGSGTNGKCAFRSGCRRCRSNEQKTMLEVNQLRGDIKDSRTHFESTLHGALQKQSDDIMSAMQALLGRRASQATNRQIALSYKESLVRSGYIYHLTSCESMASGDSAAQSCFTKRRFLACRQAVGPSLRLPVLR